MSRFPTGPPSGRAVSRYTGVTSRIYARIDFENSLSIYLYSNKVFALAAFALSTIFDNVSAAKLPRVKAASFCQVVDVMKLSIHIERGHFSPAALPDATNAVNAAID